MKTSPPSKWMRPLTVILWVAAFFVIMADVVRHPLRHTTMPTYRLASAQWWAGRDVYSYNAHAGFFYFPQAALLFSPFALMPFSVGELAWRLVVFGLFAYGLFRLCEVFLAGEKSSRAPIYFLVSLLALPSSLASLRNAQFDLPLAALLILSAAEVGAGRWNRAAFWLCLALALKPLALVPLLLFSALYWKLIPRVAVGLLIVIALPFLHWSPSFVAHEYVRCGEALLWAAQPNEPRYSDLGALTSHFHVTLGPALKTGLRLVFALVYLGLGAVGLQRLTLRNSAWLVGALSADYLMLFNPRTETCSFVFLGPFVATLAIYYAFENRRRLAAIWLGFSAVGLACDAFPLIHGYTDRWMKPLLALLFLPMLLQFLFEKRAEKPT